MAASRTQRGGGAPGSPFSRWTMSCPSRSRRVALASTSKAMKGATLDLRDRGTLAEAMNGSFVIFPVLLRIAALRSSLELPQDGVSRVEESFHGTSGAL